ncbi:MAG: DUF3127 domain-containing protein [Prevotella sp.]
MEITGKIIAVLPAQGGVSQRTGNPWKSQDYVIETHDTYPKKCCFRVFGEDKINQFNIQMGEEMTVSFDIDCHEYQGRWFNDVRAWAVNRNIQPAPGMPGAVPGAVPVAAPVAAPTVNAAPAAAAAPFPPAQEPADSNGDDGLPF